MQHEPYLQQILSMKSHSHLPRMVMGSTAHIYIYASFTCVQSTEFLLCKFHHGSHKLYQRIISMTHSVTLLPCPETWPRNSMG